MLQLFNYASGYAETEIFLFHQRIFNGEAVPPAMAAVPDPPSARKNRKIWRIVIDISPKMPYN